MSDELLTVDEVSALLRLSPETLRTWRSRDLGPLSFKQGRRVVYRHSDVIAWQNAQIESTAKGGVS